MNSLNYFTSFVTYNIKDYHNLFFLTYLVSGLLLFLSILSFFLKILHKNNNNKLLNLLEEVSYNTSTREKCRKILFPDKGEVVTLLNGKWSNLIGHITKYNNEDDNYNIKIYKSDNLNTNVIPKRRLFRNRIDFIVNPDI